MNLMLLQTSDDSVYKRILDQTSKINMIFCNIHDIAYQQYVGIKRGYHPWQATFNRITLLSELLNNELDWIMFLDADAYIYNLEFPIREYLAKNINHCLILAPGTDQGKWDVNAGVFFINLKHAAAQRLIQLWLEDFTRSLSDEDLRFAYYPWSTRKNDQDMLHRILRENETILEDTLIERGFMNYADGTFIRQVLRSGGQSVEGRARQARADIEQVVQQSPRALSLEVEMQQPASHRLDAVVSPPASSFDRVAVMEQFAAALYRCLLFREPDLPGLAKAVNELCSGRLNFASALRSCLASSEFRGKADQFLTRYVGSPPSVRSETLTSLANRFKSDKGTGHGVPPHRYTYLYDLIFARYRWNAINLLEIGLCAGGPEVGGPVERTVDSPSLEMWLQFFPNARIYGFDISDFSHLQNSRFTFVRGDAGSIEDLTRLADAAAGYDIVIDDGSHASQHQQLALKHLFPKLREGGTYVIEDVHWQPQVYEKEATGVPKTADFIISYFEKGVYLQNSVLSEEIMETIGSQLGTFAWFPAFNGDASKPKLIVLTKRV